MSLLPGGILRDGTGNRLSWGCPGCNEAHGIQHGDGNGPRWGWNGSTDKPTFTPSVLVRTGRAVDPSHGAPEPGDPPTVCHSFVVDGQMQFLGDCDHKLAGQTVPIPPWPRPAWSDA